MRLLLVTDAWEPQTNGVVNTLRYVCKELIAMDVVVERISPERLGTIPCPSYPEIRLALFCDREVRDVFDRFAPDAVHIATEGPLGVAARNLCLSRGLKFSTSYHTRFPEYVRARWPIPLAVSYGYMRWFHDAASCTMVATPTMREELSNRGFRNLRPWSRGVDTQLFKPRDRGSLTQPISGRDPVFIYVGRVSVEKNVEAFLDAALPGTKVIVGDGPARARLQALHPLAQFRGMLHGEALALEIAAASVMVFPSRTDTFGLVMLEAMASGVPVAAFPVTGPLDVITEGVTGCMDEDLAVAANKALALDRERCRRVAEEKSWRASAQEFMGNLVPARASHLRAGNKPRVRRADPAL
jgi:glycosyltransferase involved in cell wall biosynthesis